MYISEKNYTRKTSKWKTSQLKQIWATGELHYSDAYCIQRITYDLVKDCNFFMGIVPLLRRVISQVYCSFFHTHARFNPCAAGAVYIRF